jgi:hypothetical protein
MEPRSATRGAVFPRKSFSQPTAAQRPLLEGVAGNRTVPILLLQGRLGLGASKSRQQRIRNEMVGVADGAFRAR